MSKQSVQIQFAKQTFVLDYLGALFWPEKKILIVSDMHLEKGSYHASQGLPLPVYDTHDTLKRLETLLSRYPSQNLITLGDNIHDAKALDRMAAVDLAYIDQISQFVPQWTWIIGNHDRLDFEKSALKHMQFRDHVRFDHITFSHDYLQNVSHQIIGHYHPKIKIQTKAGKIGGKCFIVTPSILFMPAFGRYTGGLDINDPAIQTHLKKELSTFYMLHQDYIWRIK